MVRYLVVSVGSGVLFGVMDGLINANPLARRLLGVYKPIQRESLNPVAGIVLDLAYGFAMAAVFLLLYASLPGQTGLLKGLSYGLMVWFFRVVMYAASQWVMFRVPLSTTLYMVAAGLGEMLTLGALYGVALKGAA